MSPNDRAHYFLPPLYARPSDYESHWQVRQDRWPRYEPRSRWDTWRSTWIHGERIFEMRIRDCVSEIPSTVAGAGIWRWLDDVQKKEWKKMTSVLPDLLWRTCHTQSQIINMMDESETHRRDLEQRLTSLRLRYVGNVRERGKTESNERRVASA